MSSMDPRMSPQTARASHARTHQKKSCLRCGSRSRPLAHASVNPLLGLTVPEIVDIGRCVALHGNLCLCNGPASGKSGQPQQRSPVVNSTDVARNSAVTGGNGRTIRPARECDSQHTMVLEVLGRASSPIFDPTVAFHLIGCDFLVRSNRQ